MGYENAPGTKLLASHCAMCARPLLDAVSVECGVGPVCRKKYDVGSTLSDEARDEANKLVHTIALDQHGVAARDALKRLAALGCDKIVERIAARWGGLSVRLEGDVLLVNSPYNEDFTRAARRVPGRRWVGAEKVNSFPAAGWSDVEAAICDCYPETWISIGDGGGCSVAPGCLADLCSEYEPEEPEPTLVRVVIDRCTDRVAVAVPYHRELVDSMRDVAGRKWDCANKLNTFPLGALHEVLGLVEEAFGDIEVGREEGEVAKPKARKSRGNRRYSRHY